MVDTVIHREAPSKPKAFSYLRFSTPEQSKGDSKRRQWDGAVQYAARHGLELDEKLTFQDLGKSAFRSANAATGRLGAFLDAVESGEVPQGSYLLVESLDRLSRDAVFEAQILLSRIISMGVVVVTLTDGREYSREALSKDPTALLYAIIVFMRANDESATKASRLRASWENKRAQVQSKPLTGVAPAWLRLSDDRSQLEAIPERAELVERVFKMTLEGAGQHKIAATFNAEGIAPWGRGKFWHRSYIAKVLANPAVIGTLQPHLTAYDGTKKRREPLEHVEGYFPPIISEETFREAQALRQAHGAPQRGRHAHAPITNMLAGLAACSLCGSTMTRVNKGKRSQPSYVCSKAKAGAGCAYHSIRCDWVEETILRHLPGLLEDLEGAGLDGDEGLNLDQRLAGADERVDTLRTKASRIADRLVEAEDLTGSRSITLATSLRVAEAELVGAQEALRDLQERQQAHTGLTIGVRVEKALEALKEAPEGRSPSLINLALRRVFDRAVFLGDWAEPVDGSGQPRGWWAIQMEWKHGGSCLVPLVSFRAMRSDG